MSRIALVSTTFEGIDRLKPIPRHPNVDTFCFTDDAGLVDADTVATWTRVMIPEHPASELPARLRSRYFKTQVHRLPETKSHRWLAWADASLLFRDLQFMTELTEELNVLPPQRRLFLVPHPKRQTIAEEHEYICQALEKGSAYLNMRYNRQQMNEQMASFATQGMNVQSRLWAMGFWIVENNRRINECWDEWWEQILRFGAMDQIPLPPLLESFGLMPQELQVNIFGNRYFQWVRHQNLI